MSHQNPLSDEADVYDDSQNLLDIVPDGPTAEDLVYEAELKAALAASLPGGAAPLPGGAAPLPGGASPIPGGATLLSGGTRKAGIGSDEAVLNDLGQKLAEECQLEEVLLASQIETIMSLQAAAEDKPREAAVDEDLECDMADGDSPAEKLSKNYDEESLSDKLQMPPRSQTSRRLRKKREKRSSGKTKVKLVNEKTDRLDELDYDPVNPELDEVLEMQSSSANSRVGRSKETVEAAKISIKPRLLPSALDENGIPVTWDCNASQSDGSTNFTLVPLSSGNAEYDAISEEFAGAGLSVITVERLQNFILLDRYRKEREHMTHNRRDGFDINEQYLYHGTKAQKRVVCEEMLDQRLGKRGHFGRGVYFSDNPRKCLQYCETSGQTFRILKCRVILGDMKVYPKGQSDSNLKREPLKETPTGLWKYYDSVKGCPRDFNEFVIYESRRAITEYIIACKKSHDDAVPIANQRLGASSRDERTVQSNGTCTTRTLKWSRVSLNNDSSLNSGIARTENEESAAGVISPAATANGDTVEGAAADRSDSDEGNMDQYDSGSDHNSVYDSDCDSVSSRYDSVGSDTSVKDMQVGEEDSLGRDVTDGGGATGTDDQAAHGPVIKPFQPHGVKREWLPEDERRHQERILFVREEMRRQRQLAKQGKGNTSASQPKSFLPATSPGLVTNPTPSSASLRMTADLDNPVEQVLSRLAAEFLQVTETTDSTLARRYVSEADMDINMAILNYFNRP